MHTPNSACSLVTSLPAPSTCFLELPNVRCVPQLAILLFNSLCLVVVSGCAWPQVPDIDMQDTSRPIVKNHHSVVLRAESAAEKFSWLTRLLAASGSPQAARAKTPQQGSKPPSPEQPKVC